MKTHYFSPGPSRLPKPVREQIHNELLDTFGIDVSILEISHRSQYYELLNNETIELARRVFQVPKTHEILFDVVGAQQHFSLLIQHLSKPGEKISYTETGFWAHLACEEAFASSRKTQIVYNGGPEYHTIDDPKKWNVDKDSKFLHLTVNNTIYGTEFSQIPSHFDVPLVLDMTSSLGARTDIPWDKTALVYASAQKNFGIAGVSIIIIKKDLLEQSRENTKCEHLGRALCYHAIYDAHSILNTPPVFPIYCMNRTLKWIENEGGISEMEKLSHQKSHLIYSQIDKGFYLGHADPTVRSRHNFVFKLENKKLNEDFISHAEKENILEIRGHKILGGVRISAYNGVSVASVQVLADFMDHFRNTH